MAQYEYQCPHCRAITTEIKKSDKRNEAPKCGYCSKGATTKRVMSAGSFKVNGFSEANGYS